MNAGISQPCTRSLRGHVVSRGLDLLLLMGEMQNQKSFTNSFKFVYLQTFFLSIMGRGDHCSV